MVSLSSFAWVVGISPSMGLVLCLLNAGGYPEDGIEQVKTTQQLRRSIVVDDVKNFQVQKAAHERAVAAGEAEPGSFKSPLMPFSLPQISSSEFAEFLASLVENEGGKEYARKTAPKEPEKVIYDLAEYGDQAADFQQRLYEVALPVYSDDLQSWEFSDRLASDPLAAHAMLTSILSLVKVEESRASADQPNSQVFALMDAVTVCIGDFVSESTREHGKPNLTLKHVFSDTDNNPVWSYGYESNKQKWDSLISKSQEYLEYAHKRLQAVAKGKTEQSIDDEAGDEQLAIASVDPSTARKLMLCIEFIIEAMHAGRHGRSFDETNFLRKRLAQEPLSVEEQNQLIKVIEMRKQAARQIYLDNIHATAPRTLDNRTLVSIMAEYGYTVKD